MPPENLVWCYAHTQLQPLGCSQIQRRCHSRPWDNCVNGPVWANRLSKGLAWSPGSSSLQEPLIHSVIREFGGSLCHGPWGGHCMVLAGRKKKGQSGHLRPLAQSNEKRWNQRTLCVIIKSRTFPCVCLCIVTQSCLTLCDPMDCSPPRTSAMGFSRQEYWTGFLTLLQGIFPAQGWSPCLWCLLHWQTSSLPPAPSEKPFLCVNA